MPAFFLFFKPAVATEAKIELLRWTLFSPFLSVTYNRFPPAVLFAPTRLLRITVKEIGE